MTCREELLRSGAAIVPRSCPECGLGPCKRKVADANVAQLKLAEVTYNEQAIEYLETMLQQARAGQLTQFAAVYRLEGNWTHCWTGCDNLFELLGAATMMRRRIEERVMS